MATDYQPRIVRPSWLVQGAVTPTELPVYVDSTLTAPSAGTYTLTRPDGTKAVDAQSVTITSSVATRYVTLASTEALGEGWREQWDLTIGGVAKVFYRDAACVLQDVQWPISTTDLLSRHPELTNQYPTGDSNWERAIDEANITVDLWILGQGKRPYLILNAWSTREPRLLWALCYAFRMCATFASADSRFQYYAEKYEADAMKAMQAMSLTYDDDADGMPDVGEQGQSASAVIFLASPPAAGFQSTGRPWWRGVR